MLRFLGILSRTLPLTLDTLWAGFHSLRPQSDIRMPEVPRSLPLTLLCVLHFSPYIQPQWSRRTTRRNEASLGSGYADVSCLIPPAKYPSLSELLALRLLSRGTATVPSSGRLLSAPSWLSSTPPSDLNVETTLLEARRHQARRSSRCPGWLPERSTDSLVLQWPVSLLCILP